MAEPDNISIQQERLRAAKLLKTKSLSSFMRARYSLMELIDESEVINPGAIRDQRSALNSSMTTAQDTMEHMIALYGESDDVDNQTRIHDEMDKLLADYSSIMEAVQECLHSDKVSNASARSNISDDQEIIDSHEPIIDNDASQSSNVAVGGDVSRDIWRQLKRVSIPVFAGDKKLYENWKASFIACVDHSPSSAEYKLLQLRQYLSGEPLKSIENLGHSAAAYEAAKQRLDRKYGGVRRHIVAQMEEVDNFLPVRPGNARDLDKLADLLDILVINIKEADRQSELGYGSLYFKLLKKLPEYMIANYQRWLKNNEKTENVESLRSWINQESEFQMIASEMVKGLSPVDMSHKAGNFHQNKKEFTHLAQNRYDACACCEGQHRIWKCEKFQSLDVRDRWEKAKEKKLCFRCLGQSHVGKLCNRSRTCGVNGCRQLHHRLLHTRDAATVPKVRTPNLSSWSQHPEAAPVQPVHSTGVVVPEGEMTNFVHPSNVTMIGDVPGDFIALRTVPVILENKGRCLKINALLDDGSTKTYLNSDVAAELGLVGKTQRVTVSVLNGQYEVFETMPVEVMLHSVDGSVSQHIEALTTNKVTGSMKAIDWMKYKDHWPHLRDIQFARLGARSSIDMLIGVDHVDLHFAKTEIRGGPGQPIARLTPLGWTCVGNAYPQNLAKTHFGFIHTYFARDTEAAGMSEINLSLRKFWEVEEITTKVPVMSAEDRRIVQQVRQSMSYDDGTYRVNIPWKDGMPTLPNNYDMALQRLKNTEKRLQHCPEVQEAYKKTVSQYLDKAYIHKVSHNDRNDSMWFLPHFPIVRPEKATTKVRIVFDASATYNGESLNQSISQGPKLQQELFDVLLRFRKQPVAVVCDIAEMYLRIQIAETDQKYFRFLWRDMDHSRPPDIYEFSRVVFGVNCSPFIAQFVSQEHARKLNDELPMAAQTVLESTYMDDCMDSVSDESQGLELYRQLSELWKRCGMHTRKWLSNSEAVMAQIPKEDRAYEVEIEGDQLPGTKTLGVLWLATSDVFTFRFKAVEQSFICTKRNVLKKVAALFDPLGFLAPFIIRAKILLQRIWMCGLEWDELLEPDLKHDVEVWLSEISQFKDLHVPRCLCDSDSEQMTLHVFADASSDAYGAVAYMRCVYRTGKISVNLVCAKTRVAPLKSCSIPRLELMAAVLALRMGLAAARPLKIPQCDVHFWSDSMNVLWWIRNHSRSYKPFVANRVGEIQTASSPDQWHYVSTKQNPADFTSRGLPASRLIIEELWWKGPEFLHHADDSWPQNDVPIPIKSAAVKTEMRRRTKDDRHSFTTLLTHDYMHVTFPERLDPSRYSSWTRLTRVQAWVLRFVNNCQLTREHGKEGELSPDEIQESELFIIRSCQQEGFADEYHALMLQKPLSAHSKILGLNPQLDEDGMLRSNSRVVNSDVLPYDARYPIILPRKDDVTRLIVKHEHERGAHVSGTNHTLSALSQRYWIISAREAIREWELTCNECRRRKAKAATQIMAPLPSSRLNVGESLRCFVHTAVDFAGPFITIQKRGRLREKRYLCLFTCMLTRAVHLEMAFGLDTDSFLNAFYRFANRRGFPREMTSDNGTNFVGAQKELKQLVEELNKSKILQSVSAYGIKWHFNPPAGPHFGGVFEVMIKAAKRAVFAILGNADVRDEELMTAFIGAEALINSRPITYQSASPRDLLPLTPSHFLHGELGRQLAPTPVDEVKHPRTRWRRVQELIRQFWHRWLREWVPSIGARKKWQQPSKNLAVGDIVLVIQSNTVRGNWPLGKIVAVHTGRDGHVRVVDVQIGQTVFKRPITALCPLEFGDN